MTQPADDDSNLVLVTTDDPNKSVSVKMNLESFPELREYIPAGAEVIRYITTVSDFDGTTVNDTQIKVVIPDFDGYFIHKLNDDYTTVAIASYDVNDQVDLVYTRNASTHWTPLVNRLNNPEDYPDDTESVTT